LESSNLALFWIAIIGVAILVYTILDGFDLGVGILFGTTRDKKLRDEMVASISPFWDGNETWLVVIGASLFGAFPTAYAVFLPAFYIPVLLLLVALIFRGVAFEFRGRGRASGIWDHGFSAGSAVVAFVQGAAVGAMIRGIPVTNGQYSGGSWEWLEPLPVICGIGLILGYCLLGASWLVLKSETNLRDWAYLRVPWLAGGMLAFVAFAFAGAISQRAHSHLSGRPRLGACFPTGRSACDVGRFHGRPPTPGCVALYYVGLLLYRGIRHARGAVLAFHDSVRDHHWRCRRTGGNSVLPVLGRRFIRAAGDRHLHRGRLLVVPRQAWQRIWSDARPEARLTGATNHR
jgi:cytochrome bd-type quinol oxidase subunit 2